MVGVQGVARGAAEVGGSGLVPACRGSDPVVTSPRVQRKGSAVFSGPRRVPAYATAVFKEASVSEACERPIQVPPLLPHGGRLDQAAGAEPGSGFPGQQFPSMLLSDQSVTCVVVQRCTVQLFGGGARYLRKVRQHNVIDVTQQEV